MYTTPLARIWRRTPRLTTEAERVTVQAPTSPSSCSFYSLQLYTYTPPHTRQLLLLILLFDILIAGFLRRRVFEKGHTRISTNCEQQSRLAKTACHKMHNGALKPSLYSSLFGREKEKGHRYVVKIVLQGDSGMVATALCTIQCSGCASGTRRYFAAHSGA